MIAFEDDFDFSQSFDQQIIADFQSDKSISAAENTQYSVAHTSPSTARTGESALSHVTCHPLRQPGGSLTGLTASPPRLPQHPAGSQSHGDQNLGCLLEPGTPNSAMVSQLFKRPSKFNTSTIRETSIAIDDNNNSLDDDVDDCELSAIFDAENRLSPAASMSLSPIIYSNASTPHNVADARRNVAHLSSPPTVVRNTTTARLADSFDTAQSSLSGSFHKPAMLLPSNGNRCKQSQSLTDWAQANSFDGERALSVSANCSSAELVFDEGSPMPCVQEEDKKGSRKGERCPRHFPGPAGVLPVKGASLAFLHEVSLDECDDDSDAGEYSALVDTSSQMDFHNAANTSSDFDSNLTSSDVWRRAIDELDASATTSDASVSLLRRFNIGRVASVCARRRVRHIPLLVVAVRRLQPVTQLSWRAVFADDTGVMRGCIATSCIHTTSIRVGCVLILRRPAVWRSSPRAHYISVTQRSLAMVVTPRGGTSSYQRVLCDVSVGNIKDNSRDDITVTKLLPIDCDRLLSADLEDENWPSAVLAEDIPSPAPTRSSVPPSSSRGTGTGSARRWGSAPPWKRPRYSHGGQVYPGNNGARSNTRDARKMSLSKSSPVSGSPQTASSDLDALFANEADDELFSDI